MREFRAEMVEMLSQQGREVLLLRCSGVLNATVWPDFQVVLAEAEQSGRNVVFDLAQVPFVNSSALGELALLHHTLQEEGRGCALCNVHPDCLFQINLTGLDRILPVFSDVAQAMREFDGAATPCRSGEALRGKILLPQHEGDLLERGALLLCFAEGQPLLPLLEEAVRRNGGTCLRGGTAERVRSMLQGGQIWLVILDGRHPEYAAIEELTRLSAARGVSCRVCLEGGVPGRAPGPMDAAETGGLSIAELAAVARLDGRRRLYAEALLGRAITIELRSGEEACELGRVVCERLALSGGMPREEADGFFFAVREAIDNACHHGNNLDPNRLVTIHYLCTVDAITVTVRDCGNGFSYESWLELGRTGNPLLQAQQHRIEGRRGGLGIMLMCRCCDEVEYLPPGNAIRLVKHLQARK